jgi:hypothetical protein
MQVAYQIKGRHHRLSLVGGQLRSLVELVVCR